VMNTVKSSNPVANITCCKKINRNNNLAKITILILADSDQKL